MSKIKINSGLASIILLACLFSGWQTLLIVSVMMFAFCEVNEVVKTIAVKVITFYIGLTLVSTLWEIIYDGYDVITGGIGNLVNFLNCYVKEPIDISKLNQYLLTPASYVFSVLNSVVSFLLNLAKFTFIVGILLNKAGKENVVTKKINEYVTKALTFVSSYDAVDNNVNNNTNNQVQG